MAEYIEREALLEMCCNFMCQVQRNKCPFTNPCDEAGLIENAPAADVAPVVHGRWKLDVNPYSHKWNYKCTTCSGWTTDETDYCPNCGAKMDGGNDG